MYGGWDAWAWAATWVLAAGGSAGSVTSALMGKGRWAAVMAVLAIAGILLLTLANPHIGGN